MPVANDSPLLTLCPSPMHWSKWQIQAISEGDNNRCHLATAGAVLVAFRAVTRCLVPPFNKNNWTSPGHFTVQTGRRHSYAGTFRWIFTIARYYYLHLASVFGANHCQSCRLRTIQLSTICRVRLWSHRTNIILAFDPSTYSFTMIPSLADRLK